ncbi:MAG: SMC-Scp complex subunit ScpB [Lachnospiraceae bacterium]
MDNVTAKKAIEAILFTMGESVEIAKIARVLEFSLAQTKLCLKELEKDYYEKDSGLQLLWLDDHVQLGTKHEFYDYIIKIATEPKKLHLTETVLETLSIIAYKQPVTRVEIEKVRGVNCTHALNKLLEYDLVQELGRLDAPGKPLLFGTTEQFLRSFGLSNTTEMPQVDVVKVEEFKQEAEEEISAKMQV